MKQPIFLIISIGLLEVLTQNLAFGETKTFVNQAAVGSWLTAGNWTPTGLPTSVDDVLINGGTGEMRLTSGSLAIQYIEYNSVSDSRQLTINTTTGTSRTLTLNGSGSNPLIAQTGGSSTTFTIHTNSSTGSGALILQLNASGDFNVQNSGATLSISSVISETGGSRSITKTGTGTLIMSGANTYSGGTTLGTGAPNTGGTISLGADGALGSGGFTFAGGILSANNKTHTTTGTLSLSADSSLNLFNDHGADKNALIFGSASWTGGILTINGWDGSSHSSGLDDQIFINGSVDPGFLSHTYFNLDGTLYFGAMLSNELVAGDLVPVPEPIHYALGIFGLVFVGVRAGRAYLANHRPA